MATTPVPADAEILLLREIRFDPPFERDPSDLIRSDEGLAIIPDDRNAVRFDPEDPLSVGYARVLGGLRDVGRPAALALDSERRIIQVFVPHVSRVRAIRPLDRGVLSVDLEMSHARHILRDSLPAFEEVERLLREAVERGTTLIVVEDDTHDIIHVSAVPEPGSQAGVIPEELGPSGLWGRFRSLFSWLSFTCCWPWSWWRSVSASKAQVIFNDLSSKTCDPLTVPPPCIPFLYPDDGCWGRAHEMSRLMVDVGLKPRKVWIQGSLHASTANNPSCGVWWGWHVAPTLCVRGEGWLGWFRIRSLVMDPALFATPVTKGMWKGVQGDPSATLTDSSWTAFYLWGNITDPTFAQTESVLATYRLALQNRAVQFGPPPYACP